MTGIRSFAVALVQTWWAFETLMNDFASIIAKERGASLDEMTLAMLEEKRPALDKTGRVTLEPYYQPLLPRLQAIYRLLTGEELDRGGREWSHIVELKETRDAYVHRVGKESGGPGSFGDDRVLRNGFASVQSILSKVFRKTPEFAAKFVYEYLAYWCCGTEAPFIWDGSEGDSFYLGLGHIEQKAVTALFAPIPGSFSAERVVPASRAKSASSRPTRTSEPRRRRRERGHQGQRDR